MGFQRFSFFAGFLLVFFLAVGTSGLKVNAGLPNFGVVPVKPQKAAEAFQLPNLAGKQIDLQEFRGRAVLLNFWASWCGPCVEEMPSLTKLYDKYEGRGLEIVAVSTDSSRKALEKSVTRMKLQFSVLWDRKGSIATRYGARSLPTTYLIDRQGQMVGVVRGGRDWNSVSAHAWVEHLLEDKLSEASNDQPVAEPKSVKAAASNSDHQIEVSVGGPERAVATEEAFVVTVRVRWPGGIQTVEHFDFEPPEAEMSEQIELLTVATKATSEQEWNQIDFELFLVPQKNMEPGSYPIGPIKVFYQSPDGYHSVSAGSLVVKVRQGSVPIWFLAGFPTILVASGVGVFWWQKKND